MRLIVGLGANQTYDNVIKVKDLLAEMGIDAVVITDVTALAVLP